MKKQAFNPYLPSHEYIPDGEPHIFGDRVYIYGTHDKFGGNDFCLNDYVCYSAPVSNLADWRYEGVIFRRNADPDNTDNKYCLWAPDVVQGKDGKYYLYYCLSRERRLRVAVCDTPAGEYKFLGKVRYKDGTELGTKEGDYQEFDPGVFVDDDGTIYIYSGITYSELFGKQDFTPNPIKEAHVFTIEDDMLTLKTTPKKILPSICDKNHGFNGHEFFEASSVRKINGIYYYVYSSKESCELCYATSMYPDKDFKFGGTIISLGDVGYNGRTKQDALNFLGNTHGGLVQINNKWYIFYHRQTNRHQYSRQACAEQIEILADGSIPQVEMTSCGLNGGPLIGKGEYEARIACVLIGKNGATVSREKEQTEEYPFFTQDGVDKGQEENPPFPIQYIANMRSGAVAGFRYFNFENTKKISVTIRSNSGENASGKMLISTVLHDTHCGKVDIDLNSNTTAWQKFEGSITLPNGINALYLQYSGEGSIDLLSFSLE